MGLWHGVEYYEKEKLVGEEYYQQWSNVSIQFYFFEITLLYYIIILKMFYKILKVVYANRIRTRNTRYTIC